MEENLNLSGETATKNEKSPRVLYSFPFRIGTERICSTAWYQVVGAALGVTRMTVLSGSLSRSLPQGIRNQTTLSCGSLRLPIGLLGIGHACRIHDWITARWLKKHAADIDVVHGWPLASLQTMRMAKRLAIPFLLERPNTHSAYAYEASAAESEKVGISLPRGHDHEFNQHFLDQEYQEYEAADYLLCPSEFVAQTFRDRGFGNERLLRHHYGFDEKIFISGQQNPLQDRGLVMLYVGVCEPRKGLHYALEAWLKTKAHRVGRFMICGSFVPGYAEKLQKMLDHPSVEVLGHRSDIPQLMRDSDLLVLSSVEEGSALVTYEAMGAGCVLLVSDGAGAVANHMTTAMIHPMRNIEILASHIDRLDSDRNLLKKLRSESILSSRSVTWKNAGELLSKIYSDVVNLKVRNHQDITSKNWIS